MSKFKKCFIVSFFVVLLFVLYQIDCFAVTVIDDDIPQVVWDTFNSLVSKGENGYYDNDNHKDCYAKNYFVMSGSYDSYLFMFYEDGYFNTSTNKFICKNSNSSGILNHFWLEIKIDGTYLGHSTGGKDGYYYCSDSSVENIWYPNLVYSTFDIYDQDNNLFFQQAPQGITATLVEETQKAEIMNQMKVMIVGFLRYLIVLVISLLAFWKGWQFLSTQLKKA